MLVKDLIEELQELDPEMEIWKYGDEFCEAYRPENIGSHKAIVKCHSAILRRDRWDMAYFCEDKKWLDRKEVYLIN